MTRSSNAVVTSMVLKSISFNRVIKRWKASVGEGDEEGCIRTTDNNACSAILLLRYFASFISGRRVIVITSRVGPMCTQYRSAR